MNRVVKFRGKSLITFEELDHMEIKHENGWVFGNLISNGKFPFIVGDVADWEEDYIAHEWFVAVEPESVGQYTGLKDKTGKTEVYQDDVIEIDHGSGHKWREKVIFHRGCFMAGDDNLLINVIEDATVIGSFHDNPELLEAAK